VCRLGGTGTICSRRLLLKTHRRVDGQFARQSGAAINTELPHMTHASVSGVASVAQFFCRSPKALAIAAPQRASATQRQALRPSGMLLDHYVPMPASVFSSPDAGFFFDRLARRPSRSSPAPSSPGVARRWSEGRVPFGGGCVRRSAGARSLRRPEVLAAEPCLCLASIRGPAAGQVEHGAGGE
jgi:hypothetical protein